MVKRERFDILVRMIKDKKKFKNVDIIFYVYGILIK